MNLRLPLHHRVYFCVRRLLVKTLRAAIACGVFLRWPWLVFNVMSLQKRLGLRFHR